MKGGEVVESLKRFTYRVHTCLLHTKLNYNDSNTYINHITC